MKLFFSFLVTVVGAADFWFTSQDRLPLFYGALIATTGLMAVMIFIAIPANRPRRVIREPETGTLVYDSHRTVCEIGGWKWDREQFCSHWFITGDTGIGKTSAGLNKILISLTEHCPQWGGLVLDPKGAYWRTVKTMLDAARCPDDFALLRIRSPLDTEDLPKERLNLIGDSTIPTTAFAQMIADVYAAQKTGSGGGNEDFFNQRALEHISKCLDLMRVLHLPFTLCVAYEILSNKATLKSQLEQLSRLPNAIEHFPIVSHFETFFLSLKSDDQSEGELATIANYLAPYQTREIAAVFCSEQPDTVRMSDLDTGKKLCLSFSIEYKRERPYIFTFLKLLFYNHGMRRLDLKGRDEVAFWRKNLLVLVGEEFQNVVTSSENGMSDYTVSGMIREAGVALLLLSQSHVSLLPAHKSKEQATVLTLNLRNRMIFRAADEECALKSADFIGKRKVQKRTRSTGPKGIQYSYQDADEHKIKTHQLRELPNFTAILVHSGRPGQFKKAQLRPLSGENVKQPSNPHP